MKWLQNSTIANKLFSSFLLVMIPLIIVSMLINYMSMGIAEKEIRDSYSSSLEFLANSFDNSFAKFKLMVDILSADEDLNALNQSPLDAQVSLEYAEFIRKLSIFSFTNELEPSIIVYLLDKERALSSKDGLSRINIDDPILNYCDDVEKLGRWFLQEKYIQLKRHLVFSYLQNNTYFPSTEGVAAMIEIEESQIKRLLASIRPPEGGTVFLWSEGHSISNTNLHQLDLMDIGERFIENSEGKGQFVYKQDGQKYWIIFNKSNSVDVFVASYFTQEQIIKPIMLVRGGIVFILLLNIVLAIYFSMSTYKNFLLPFHRLVHAMKAVQDGNLKVRIQEIKDDELGFVFHQFNSMVSRMDHLINEVYEAQLNLQKSNLQLLQSQIKPHFLYNCLNFIYRMIMAEDMEGASKMTLYLGKYFRYATRMDRNITTIKDELENIHSYIEIQNTRYPGKISYTTKIPGEIEEFSIPRLLIQPIVENALVHGIKGIGIPIHISIHGRVSENIIVIQVEDNGKGMDQDKVDEINKELNNLITETGSFGLRNVFWRLKMYFGDGAEMKLINRVPKGISVMITIPCPKGGMKDV